MTQRSHFRRSSDQPNQTFAPSTARLKPHDILFFADLTPGQPRVIVINIVYRTIVLLLLCLAQTETNFQHVLAIRLESSVPLLEPVVKTWTTQAGVLSSKRSTT